MMMLHGRTGLLVTLLIVISPLTTTSFSQCQQTLLLLKRPTIERGFIHPTTFVPTTTPSSCFITSQEWSTEKTFLLMSSSSDENKVEKGLPFWLDIGTKGGAIVWSFILFVVPIAIYNLVITVNKNVDPLDVGVGIGVGFTVLAMLGWMSTYIFRVATKDMTYAQQLKDYENAVIAKRLEELDEDEVLALVEEVEKDDF